MHRYESLVMMVVRGLIHGMAIYFFLKATEPYFLTNFVSNEIDLKPLFLNFKINELTSNCY